MGSEVREILLGAGGQVEVTACGHLWVFVSLSLTVSAQLVVTDHRF